MAEGYHETGLLGFEDMDQEQPSTFRPDNSKQKKVYIGVGLAVMIVLGAVIGMIVVLVTKGGDDDDDAVAAPMVKTTDTSAPPTEIPTPPAPTLSAACPASMDVDQSKYDTNKVKVVKLNNCVKAVMISDPSTTTSYVSMSAAIGYLDDPDDFHGLNQVFSQSLIYGSEKYPETDGFAKHMDKNDGFYNSWDTRDHTLYYYIIAPDGLKTSLDMFASYFDKPLFKNTSVTASLATVATNTEYSLGTDAMRQFMLEVSTSNPKSPFNRFPYGTKEALEKHNLQDEVKAFFEKNYNLDKYTLLVKSDHSFDDIEAMLQTSFGTVSRPATTTEEPLWLTNPEAVPQAYPTGANPTRDLTDKRFTKKIQYMKPVAGDINQLYVKWPNEFGLLDVFPEDPASVFTYLFGQEMSGGISARLREEGLAIEMHFAGLYDPTSWFTTLGFVIELTPEGAARVDYIMQVIYNFVALMQEQQKTPEGLEPWFNAKREADAANWYFNPATRFWHIIHMSYEVTRPANPYYVLQPPQKRIYDASVVSSIVEKMTPENCIVTLLTPDPPVPLDLTELYAKFPYAENDISEAQRASWTAPLPEGAVYLPPSSMPFLYTVEEAEAGFSAPAGIVGTPKNLTWNGNGKFVGFQRGAGTEKPFSEFVVRMYRGDAVPVVHNTPDAAKYAAMEVYLAAFDVALAQIKYPAGLVGMTSKVAISLNYIDVQLSGVFVRQPELMEQVLSALRDPLGYMNNATNGKQARFDFVRQQTKTRLAANKVIGASWGFNVMDAKDIAHSMLREELTPVPTVASRVAALETLKMTDVVFTELSTGYTTGMCQALLLGNFDGPLGVLFSYQKAITKTGFCAGSEPAVVPTVQSQFTKPAPGFYIVQAQANTTHDATFTALVLGVDTIEVEARSLLLSRFFPGKVCYLSTEFNVRLVKCRLSGQETAAEYEATLDSHLANITRDIDAETDTGFEQLRDSVRSILLKKPTTMEDEIWAPWNAIITNTHDWSRAQRVADEVMTVTKTELEGWAHSMFDEPTAVRVSLELFTTPPPHAPYTGNTSNPILSTRGQLKAQFPTF